MQCDRLRKDNANPIYVWEVAEEQFNIIKGCGCVVDQRQIEIFSEIVRVALL